MQRKDTLHTFSVGDPAHGKCFIESPAFTANDYASKYLDSLFVPFHHAGMNAYAIPDRKRYGVASVLFFLNRIDDLIHENTPSPPARTGEQFPPGYVKLQPPTGSFGDFDELEISDRITNKSLNR
jgi:hypothetical protein